MSLLPDNSHLLTPLSPSHPTGVDIRADSKYQQTYFQLKDTRRDARALERKHDQIDPASQPIKKWHKISKQCHALLCNTTKDIEIACWYLEALCRTQGMQGVCDGLALLQSLIDQYWGSLHPKEDPPSIESKIDPVISLNGLDRPGTLVEALALVPIALNEDERTIPHWQYQQAQVNQNHSTLQAIASAAAHSPPAFYRDSLSQVEQALAQFTQLSATLDRLCAPTTVPSSNIHNALVSLKDNLMQIAPVKLTAAPTAKVEPPTPQHHPAITPAYHNGYTRESALNTLLDIANFFAHKEPHSPLPYLLRRAVHWGELPLPALLNEWVNDEHARDTIFKLTGIDNSNH